MIQPVRGRQNRPDVSLGMPGSGWWCAAAVEDAAPTRMLHKPGLCVRTDLHLEAPWVCVALPVPGDGWKCDACHVTQEDSGGDGSPVNVEEAVLWVWVCMVIVWRISW